MNAVTDSRDLAEHASRVAGFLRVALESVQAITNVRTTVTSIGTGEAVLPATVNSPEPDNAWIVSPHTAYVRYADEELRRFGHPVLTRPLGVLCGAMGGYFRRCEIDRAVAVNNWLISTNLYPPIEQFDMRRCIAEAVDRWPTHAIWFRSLNDRYTADWLAALKRAGGVLVPSRQVYLYDRIRLDATHPPDLRRDFRLLRTTPLKPATASEWSADDFRRAAELYDLLYMQKYSQLNPYYTARFLELWHDAGLLELLGYRDAAGTLQAVVGVFADGRTITSPIVGYDTTRPQKEGLYRILAASVFAHAAKTGMQVNLSAGVAEFKRLRGGVGAIEYSVVFTHHLPPARQRAIRILGSLTRHIGEPIMRRFRL